MDASPHSAIELPPATFWGTLKCIGPGLIITAKYFRHVKTPPALRPGAAWTFFLWVSTIAMTTVGIYLAGKSLKLWP